MPTQAEINAEKINKLIIIGQDLKNNQDVLMNEVINILNVLDKLNDKINDIEMNVKELYLKSKKEDIKTEPIKTGWIF